MRYLLQALSSRVFNYVHQLRSYAKVSWELFLCGYEVWLVDIQLIVGWCSSRPTIALIRWYKISASSFIITIIQFYHIISCSHIRSNHGVYFCVHMILGWSAGARVDQQRCSEEMIAYRFLLQFTSLDESERTISIHQSN